MQTPTLDQLKRALHLQESIEALQKELSSLFTSASVKALGLAESGMKVATGMIGRKKRTMSKAARAKIAAAQKLRWAKVKKTGSKSAAGKTKTKRKKSKMSAAGRAAIIAAQKARWAKVRAEKGNKS